MIVQPTGHSLEEPDSNLAEKIHIVFHLEKDRLTVILSKDDAVQLAQDILDNA